MSVEIKADIRHWLRELDKKYFFVMLGFAVMVYFPLISLRLTNTWMVCGQWLSIWRELGAFQWAMVLAGDQYSVRFGLQRNPQCGGDLGAGVLGSPRFCAGFMVE